jgi:hypothetical protein
MELTQLGTDCKHFGEYLSGPHAPESHRYFKCNSPKMAELLPGAPVCTNLVACSTCKHHERLVFPQWEWAVGMQSSTRELDYAERTLEGIFNNKLSVKHYFDSPRLGPFGRFMVSMLDLYMTAPFASAYMYIQDDVELAPNARETVEQMSPSVLPPVLSLYTAPEYSGKRCEQMAPGWIRYNEGHESPGACCYVFSQPGLLSLLTDPVVLWHKRYGPSQGWRDIDGCVGIWARQHGGIWHHVPPLATHIGNVSSIER